MANYNLIQVNEDGSEVQSGTTSDEFAPAPTLGGKLASLIYQNPGKWFYVVEVE